MQVVPETASSNSDETKTGKEGMTEGPFDSVTDKQRLQLIAAGGQPSKCIFKSAGHCSKSIAVTVI